MAPKANPKSRVSPIPTPIRLADANPRGRLILLADFMDWDQTIQSARQTLQTVRVEAKRG
jgi:hypothetical protein